MSTATDVDIGLMAEVGAAITRGASEVRQNPQATPASHAAKPVPSTTSQTPETISSTSPVPIFSDPPQSLVGHAANYGAEALVTGICATAGAIGGSAAGEIVGGDMAVNNLGPLALPLGPSNWPQCGPCSWWRSRRGRHSVSVAFSHSKVFVLSQALAGYSVQASASSSVSTTN